MNNLINTLKDFFTSVIEPIGKFGNFLTKPHASITEVGERRRAQLLSALSLLFFVSFTWAILSNPRTLGGFFIFLGITLTAYITSRTRFYGIGAYFLSFAFTSIAYINIFNGTANSIDTSLASIVPISLILASAILSQRGFFILVITIVAATALIRSYADPKFLSDPLFSFGRTIGTITSTSFILYSITLFRASVERARLKEVQEFNRELETLSAGLEQRVAERTKALATSTEVSRRLSTILDQKQLVAEVVKQVRNSFGYYHTQIYFYDEARENLVMAGGTGEAGRLMLEQFHKLAHGRGLVGRAAESNKPILVADTAQNPEWLPNPLLPETRSEVTIPISIGDLVLGVLDVQHNVTDGLQREDVDALQSISNQVAVALQNIRQYRESQQFKLGIENSGDAVFVTDTKGTITYVNSTFEKVYGYTRPEVIGNTPRIIKSGLLTAENYQAFWGALLSKNSITGEIVNRHKDGHLVYIAGTNSAIVDDAGEIIGFLAVHHDITEQKHNQELLTQRAQKQEALNSITQKIQSTTSVDAALQITARELGHALGMKATLVELNPEALTGKPKGN
ncbi:MAG: PAS domain S-box protein [Anaerolineales bacterium]|nr:PAS domain S-box protein [Anaerolineales bacterium]